MSRSDRVFRWLLRLFPADFRGDFGADMSATFRDQRLDVLERGGPAAGIRLWCDTIRGVLATAPREHLDLLAQDVRYALRNLRRNPAFTAVAVLALATGIGANAAVFTIVDGVLLRPLPYARPHELVVMFEKMPGAPVPKFDFSAPDFEFARGAVHAFSGMFAFRNQRLELSGIGEPQRVVGTRVSPDMFAVLGVAPLLGRPLTSDDDRSRAKVVVIGYGLWTRAFGRDPAIVGRRIDLDRTPYTIVGVMGERFEFPPRGGEQNFEPAALYMPIAFTDRERRAWGAMYNNTVIARLQPGTTLERARGEMAALVPRLAQQYPVVLHDLAAQLSIPMGRFSDEVVGESRRVILVLMGAVAIVLLIGCADVANLMLTRAGTRQRELAVRSALGASPTRVVRQLLTEGLVLAAIGGSAGLLLAWWATAAMLALAGTSLPRVESIAVDYSVVLFTAALSLATPLLFGVAPALRAAMRSTCEALKESSTRAPGTRRRQRLLGGIVVAQFALALMLSIGAGLLVRSFMRLLATSPGFSAEQVVTASVQLPSGRYATGEQVKKFYADAVDAIQRLPGMTAAAASTDRPLDVFERRTFTPEAPAQELPEMSRVIAASWVTGAYFDALGIPLKRGRYLSDADRQVTRRVVVINEMLAARVWPNQNPVGRRIKWGIASSDAPWMTVVGVVGNVNQSALGTATIAQTYEPIEQQPNGAADFYRRVNLLVRSQAEPGAALALVRTTVQRLDPQLPISDAQPVAAVVADSVKPQRFSMTIVGAFALVALGLAAIGIYGVLANAVAQQTHDIGVRMALGANARDIVWSVLRRALALMAAGVAIGMAGALGLARLMAGLLYEVQPTDATAFGAAAIVLALAALGASLVPAWRATRVDPLVALRAD